MRAFAILALCAVASPCQTPTAPARTPPGAAAPKPDAEVKPEDRGSLEGVVVHQQTGAPLPGVSVTAVLSPFVGGDGAGATTGADGRFLIKDLPPGRYSLSASRDGFIRVEYGATVARSSGAMISLAPGERLRDLKFQLMPHAVITGRVLDENGEPMSGVFVSLLRYHFSDGRRTPILTGQTNSNDLGEYRMFGLPPGRYYCRAMSRLRLRGDPDVGYPPVFYPNASDLKSSSQLVLTSGVTLSGIDFVLRRAPAFRIAGRVTGEERLPPDMAVMLQYRDPGGYEGGILGLSDVSVKDGGEFEVTGVVSGSYFVMAQQMSGAGPRLAARVPLDVSRNVEGLELRLNGGVDVSGQVLLEDGEETKPFAGEGLSAQLVAEGSTQMQMMGPSNATAEEEGRFRIRALRPDTYQFNVFGLPADVYVKAVRTGDADHIDTGLDLNQGVSPGPVTLLLSRNGAQIEGEVQDEKQRPVSAAQVLLVPETAKRQLTRLFKVASSDQNGRFAIKGIAPGSYKLFAVRSLESGAQFDPEFLEIIESKGKSLRLAQRGREQMSLQVIPVPDRGN